MKVHQLTIRHWYELMTLFPVITLLGIVVFDLFADCNR